MSARRVAVVGAGISGVAAAPALPERGLEAVVLDRGHRIGGRMATRTLRDTGLPYDGRVVDVGAAYLTADDPAFAAVVDPWVARGLARAVDRHVPRLPARTARSGSTTGPMRYAAPAGLRSLVEDLAADLPDRREPARGRARSSGSTSGVLVDGERFDAVGPRACPARRRATCSRRTTPRPDATRRPSAWTRSSAVVAAYDERLLARASTACSSTTTTVLTFVADDGRRRGDDAPVLVAHADAVLAAGHLDDPPASRLERPARGAASTRWAPRRSRLVRRHAAGRSRSRAGQPPTSRTPVDGVIGLCGDALGRRRRGSRRRGCPGHALGSAVAASPRLRPVALAAPRPRWRRAARAAPEPRPVRAGATRLEGDPHAGDRAARRPVGRRGQGQGHRPARQPRRLRREVQRRQQRRATRS